jgi:hypothetical protein
LQPFIPQFPRECLVHCCDKFYKRLSHGDNYISLPVGTNVKVYKAIFDWLANCVESVDIIDFPEVGFLSLDLHVRLTIAVRREPARLLHPLR